VALGGYLYRFEDFEDDDDGGGGGGGGGGPPKGAPMPVATADVRAVSTRDYDDYDYDDDVHGDMGDQPPPDATGRHHPRHGAFWGRALPAELGVVRRVGEAAGGEEVQDQN